MTSQGSNGGGGVGGMPHHHSPIREAPLPRPLETAEEAAYKKASQKTLLEYFDSEDKDEVKTRLDELGSPSLRHLFVRRALSMSMDRGNREREMVSELFVSLSDKGGDEAREQPCVTPDMILAGFRDVLRGLEELEHDVPNAADLVGTFIARAVVDDIIPPAFVWVEMKDVIRLPGEAIEQARVLLAPAHAAERVLRCWGGENQMSVPALKESFKRILVEFHESHDAAEASTLLRDMHVPDFHHEFIKRAVTLGVELEGSLEAPMRYYDALMRMLEAQRVVSPDQMATGYARVSAEIDDLALDCPWAVTAFAADVARASEPGGWLQPELYRAALGRTKYGKHVNL